MQRRTFIRHTTMASAALAVSSSYAFNEPDFPVVRISEADRKFRSTAVEKIIAEVKKKAGNKEIAWLLENCFPNTLDTTVEYKMKDGRPDTFVITGDIHAMWLRDSTAQVWPYMSLMKEDAALQRNGGLTFEIVGSSIISALQDAHCICNGHFLDGIYKNRRCGPGCFFGCAVYR